MALQKWAAPAGSPLITTRTATGTGGVAHSAAFASAGEIITGAQFKLHAAGVITTTGAPTLGVYVRAGDDTGTSTATAATASGVTGQGWTLDATVTVRSETSVVYDITTSGLFASDTHDVTVVTVGALAGTWEVTISWDTADAGDTITMLSADALWIG